MPDTDRRGPTAPTASQLQIDERDAERSAKIQRMHTMQLAALDTAVRNLGAQKADEGAEPEVRFDAPGPPFEIVSLPAALPWAVTSTTLATPTVTTGDGFFVTDYDSGTRYDKLTGVSPTITGTGVLVAQLTVDASTSAGTWTTAWVFAACADMDSLPAGAQSDTTHLRRPIWFITRAGSGPYTMTMERVWFGHVTNGMWRPPFA